MTRGPSKNELEAMRIRARLEWANRWQVTIRWIVTCVSVVLIAWAIAWAAVHAEGRPAWLTLALAIVSAAAPPAAFYAYNAPGMRRYREHMAEIWESDEPRETGDRRAGGGA